MTRFSSIAPRIYGALGAVAMSLTLFASYFATPEISTLGGMVA